MDYRDFGLDPVTWLLALLALVAVVVWELAHESRDSRQKNEIVRRKRREARRPREGEQEVSAMAEVESRSSAADKYTDDTNPIVVPAGAAAVMLLGALGRWPYGYFVLLRWVVCIAAIVVVYTASGRNRAWAVWLFAFIALLFNPLVPIHLTREIWKPIDLASAAVFVVAIFALRR